MLKNKDKDLLASLIIGDGCVFKGTSYYLFVGHGAKQKDYCQWKLDLLNSSGIFDGDIEMHTKPNGKDNKFIMYYFRKGNPCLKYIYDSVIKEGRKNVFSFLQMMKTKQSLAIWFMDDGSVEYSQKKHKNGDIKYCRPNLKLCTNSFSLEEHYAIQKWFKDKYKVDCRIKTEKARNKDGLHRTDTYYLRFCADDAEKLYKDVLCDYIHCCPSMEYKFRYMIQAFE